MELAATAVDRAAPSARNTIPFRFTATGGEYFRIWIVNLLLTLLTLGIYSAWAKVRRLRYFYGNTSLDASAFEYHGEPLQILKGRLIAFGALIAYSLSTQFLPALTLLLIPVFAFALPWVIMRSRKFQMQMTSWRNLRFRFHGTYSGALAAYVGWSIVATLFAFMMPTLLYKRVAYVLNGTAFGNQRFGFERTVGPYYRIYYLTLLLAIVAIISLAVLAGGLFHGIASFDKSALSAAVIANMLGIAVVLILVAMPIWAFYEARFVNLNFDELEIGPHRIRCELKTGKLAYLYVTNLLGMVFTLGLFYPWARVRRLQYQFESMSLETVGSLDNFVASAEAPSSATADEVGEMFDVDFGF